MPTIDPRRIADQKDAWVTALYAKTAGSTADDGVLPLIIDSNGYLLVNLTVGTLSITNTSSTINNSTANPVNVALTSTVVSVTLPPALTTTAVTINNAAGNPANVALTQTRVSVTMITGQNGVSANVGAVDAGTQRTVIANDVGRTLTGSTGTISATFTTIFTPTNKCKVYAISFTTTSASEVTVLVCDGTFANPKEKWRVTLMAPAGTSNGANLAVDPPGYIFSSRTASAITISLSTAVLVHYSLAYFDEA